MRSLFYATLGAIAFVAPSACFVEVVEGSGEAATEQRELAPFSSLTNTSFLDVTLSLAAEQLVEVTCDDNLLKYLETVVSEAGELLLRQRLAGDEPNTYVSLKPNVDCGVTLAATELRRAVIDGSGALRGAGAFDALARIESGGSGAIDLAGIAVDDLGIILAGSGAIAVSGSATHLGVESGGSGALEARSLVAQDGDVLMSGSGDVAVNLSGCLNASVTGSGDLYVSGGALMCEVEAPGSGQVIVE